MLNVCGWCFDLLKTRGQAFKVGRRASMTENLVNLGGYFWEWKRGRKIQMLDSWCPSAFGRGRMLPKLNKRSLNILAGNHSMSPAWCYSRHEKGSIQEQKTMIYLLMLSTKA